MSMQILVIFSIIVTVILIAAILAPITICIVVALNRRPTLAVNVQILIFKARFAIKKRKEKAPSKRIQGRPGRKTHRQPKISGTALLPILLRERTTAGQTIRAALLFIKNLHLSVDRYIFSMNINGALPSPDLTGQFYGLVAALKTIGSDSVLLNFKPDFAADKLQGQIAVGTTFRIYRVIRELLHFIGNLPKLKLIRLYRVYRKESAHV
jgi:hypothetical protein